jgi:HEAT repeat protein
VKYGDSLEHAAMSGLQTSSDRARAVLDAIGAGDGSLRPFFGGEASPGLTVGQARAKKMARALEPAVLGFAHHPNATLRTKAVILLAHSDSDAATDAVVSAVSDPNESVQRIAIAAIGSHANPRAVAAVGKLLATHENWAMRILAVQALGRLGSAGSSGEAARHLREAAGKDSYALVREAALKALASFDTRSGQELAQRMATTDAEPRVRETAAAIARGAH